MKPTVVIAAAILFSSCVVLGFSQPSTHPCLASLLPCQPYLHSPSPPPNCCVPLNHLINAEDRCLCEILNDASLLKSLNMTKEDGVKLSKNCGAKADPSVCDAAGAGAPVPAVAPKTPAGPPPNSNASGLSSAVGSKIIAIIAVGLVSLVFLASQH